MSSIERKAQRRASERQAFGALIAMFERHMIWVLVVFVIIGFGLRARGLSEVGLAEDEARKVEAVRAYRAGEIAANAEHPMLMKTLIYVSTLIAETLRTRLGAEISDEAAVRFPNVLFGSLTAIPLFLLAAALFDRRIGLIAAALWSTGVNAITYNRIAKEDTLLVFFMLLAFYFYLRAKQASSSETRRKRRCYVLSGVAFGLMLASKYFPHYFGLNMLYHHLVRVRQRAPGEPRGHTPAFFYLITAAIFLLANPAALLPQTWHYLTSYTSEQLLRHHGYLMGDRLYPNQISSTPFGTPPYFYLLFLATKTPLLLLAALVIGLAVIVRRWRVPGPAFLLMMFLLWIVPYSLVGAKWLRYTLSLMPFVYMIAAVGIAWLAVAVKRFFAQNGLKAVAPVVAVSLAGAFVAVPAHAAFVSCPHFGLYTNRLAADRAGYHFPHDEFYDDGLREALLFVCASAPQGATVAHETPSATRYYFERCGRLDLQPRPLSDPDFGPSSAPRPTFYILQRGRTYFENWAEMEQVRASAQKVFEVVIKNKVAAEVYVHQD
ncbi:MAG: hypothetical protein C4334_10065 [Pyrinomonas sp.]|uniref:ArnT family glycosyltransferase n=1 Tax=Pyrinomonas sp. TaxID=2080306 RepID=UPI0033278692